MLYLLALRQVIALNWGTLTRHASLYTTPLSPTKPDLTFYHRVRVHMVATDLSLGLGLGLGGEAYFRATIHHPSIIHPSSIIITTHHILPVSFLSVDTRISEGNIPSGRAQTVSHSQLISLRDLNV